MKSSPQHIAVLRTDRLGDMVLTLPMFPILRKRFPTAKLTLITAPYVKPLLEQIDCIDEVHYVQPNSKNIGSILRTHAIDTVFAPRPRASEAWQMVLAGVQRRIGSGYRWYSPLYTTRIFEHRSDAAFHEAEYNARMIMHAFDGVQSTVHLVSPRPGHVRPISKQHRIVIHPGSGGSAKDWPAERFGQLAARLEHELQTEIIITGIDSERQICNIVASQCTHPRDLCGKLSLSEMIDLLADADLLVANSTGVLHVAASLGSSVLGLFPSTPSMSALRWGPYTDRAVVLESGPGDDMLQISVDKAFESAVELLRSV